MNSYSINASPPTLSTFMAASIFLAGLGATNVYASEPAVEKAVMPRASYFSDALPYAQAAHATQVSAVGHDAQFVSAVSGFYSQLFAEQQPMDREISALLSENLWELYAD